MIYLFRGDMSGVYLTLNQGTQALKSDPGFATAAKLERRANLLRSECGLQSKEFDTTTPIDLCTKVESASLYVPATVGHRLHDRGSVPEDRVLLKDLRTVLAAYERVIPSRRILASVL